MLFIINVPSAIQVLRRWVYNNRLEVLVQSCGQSEDIHTEKTRRERDTSTPMFIAALSIIARTWKHAWAQSWSSAALAARSVLPSNRPATNSRSLLKLTSIGSVMPSNYLVLCCPLLPLPSIFPSIRVLSSAWGHKESDTTERLN